MKISRLLLLCCLTCQVGAGLLAQETELIHNTFEHLLFDEENTWRSSAGFINDIVVTRDGHLWVGTNTGLICWNGSEKLIYDNSSGNPFKLHGGMVKQIFETGGHDLLLFTQEESLQIELLRNSETTSEIIDKNGKGERVKGYLADMFESEEEEEIFVAYNEGTSLAVYGLDDHHLKLIQRFTFDVNIGQEQLKIACHDQAIWAAIKGRGVWRRRGEVQEQVMNFESLPNSVELLPELFFEDKNERLWLAINGLKENLFCWDKDAFKPFENPLKYAVDHLREDHLGNLLFISGKYPASINEAYALKDSSWLNYTPYIDSTMLDIRPGKNLCNSFFALTKDNIAQIEIKKRKVKNYLKQQVINRFGEIIMGIEEDLDGNVFCINENGRFYKLEKETEQIREILVRDQNGNVITTKCGGAMHRDQQGKLWYKVCDGKKKGILIRFDPLSEKFTFFHHPELIRDFDIDESGQFWVTHHSDKDKRGKLSRFELSTFTYVPVKLESTFAEPRYLYIENDSSLWIGTLKGLVHVNTKSITYRNYTTENSALKSDHAIVITKGPDNWLMMGTYGDGLQFFDPKSNKALLFNEENGLTDNYVCGIIPIGSNRYWLSTFEGVSYFDFNEQSFYNYKEEDGFSNNEFNRYSFLKTNDGTNYLGSVNGLNVFRTKDLAPSSSSGKIKLAGIKKYYGAEDSLHVVRHNLDVKKTLRLRPQVTFVELSFYSTDFTEWGPSNFYTKLQPYDNDWVFAEGQKVRYRNLPPGEYKLEVKGQYGAEFLKMDIVSMAPIYSTWWFNLAVLALLTGIIAAIAKYRINKFREEEEATREINKKFAELELQALQAQLNPHFIFNALGAIQHTVRDKNPERAEHFLTSFALLMRLFLESSKKKHITLAEEIELITRYVELEQLRFENRFDFVFDVDEQIDIYSTEIPSLLFQPFVENAINHGLFHKKGQGLLSISIKEKAEALHCEIQDNGVGRKRSAEIQKATLRSHKSRATAIVNERLEILKKVEGLDLTIDIEDLMEGGTRVVIVVPVEED